VRNLLLGLNEADLLQEFHTTVAMFSNGIGSALGRLPFASSLNRRRYPEELREKVCCHPWRECLRTLSIQLKWKQPLRHEVGFASIDAVIRSLDAAVARRLGASGAAAVYAYEDGALATFRSARTSEMKCIYEHPVVYWREAQALMREEAEREPQWAGSISGLSDSSEKLERKDEELALSDHIVVASEFSRKSLDSFPGELAPITVVPYGAPPAIAAPRPQEQHFAKSPLRVLFVGGLGQMKGLSYLFRSVAMLGNAVALTVIGRKPAVRVPVLDQALQTCRWIETLPHERVLEEMAGHDVLVFPSLAEGFGMVATEALSQGLPVIATPNTCGPEVLTAGEDGFVVPIRDAEAIAAKLELLHRDRQLLASMSENARKKAEALTWDSYCRGAVAAVREALAA